MPAAASDLGLGNHICAASGTVVWRCCWCDVREARVLTNEYVKMNMKRILR